VSGLEAVRVSIGLGCAVLEYGLGTGKGKGWKGRERHGKGVECKRLLALEGSLTLRYLATTGVCKVHAEAKLPWALVAGFSQSSAAEGARQKLSGAARDEVA
jgi:hypothetical protein